MVLGSGAYFIYSEFRPVLNGETTRSIKPIETDAEFDNLNTASTKFENARNLRETSASEYRKLAQQMDAELQAKLRLRKESRISTQGREAQIELVDRQLAERQEVYEKFKDQSEDERSIGFGMRQEIEKLKSDPPTY